jgi:hypothetical protein
MKKKPPTEKITIIDNSPIIMTNLDIEIVTKDYKCNVIVMVIHGINKENKWEIDDIEVLDFNSFEYLGKTIELKKITKFLDSMTENGFNYHDDISDMVEKHVKSMKAQDVFSKVFMTL